MVNERVNVYIDGGNFFHLALRKLGLRELDFLFDDFVNYLASGRTIPPHGKRYYVGTVREQVGNPKSIKAMSKQTKLFNIFKSYNWEIKTTKLRTRNERIIIDDRVVGYQDLLQKGVKEIEYQRVREKGIDVKLATDLIVGAVDDRYDTAIIVSSDADLFAAMDWVRFRKGKKVEYIGFSILDKSPRADHTKPLQSMITHSDIQRVFVESDLRPFMRPLNQKSLL